ncbi:MAG TPA: acetyl-CoA C-acyltransferase [Candidatus Acidoferrales bacterium]|jgi:acetyl-CoA C-acetyltransferase|nr:acetyl-CoA C-acyltransferase [Candidatus Acidoferrales bacterium]
MPKNKSIWIVAAKRTVQGRFLGALAKYSATELGIAAGKAALKGLDPAGVDMVIVGNVLSAGLGMNIARQIAIGAGAPISTPAYTVNMMCASGMHAVILAIQTIQTGAANMVLCGGTESMSNAPYLLERARSGYRLGNGVLVDSLLCDGLTDAFNHEHMGLTAEKIASVHNISREAQDNFAVSSQHRYATAKANGHFCEELVTIDALEQDEHPRPATTIADLASLKPIFNRDGSITAGNSSGLNDGAAMLVLCDETWGRERGLTPLAVITGHTVVGCDPSMMGMGPVYATRKLSQNPREFDIVELNEAFAAQALACIKELGLDQQKVNPDGGAISLGHPIGASGARLLVHLAHRRPKRGLATLCVGGGMGYAVSMEQP